MAWHEEPTLAEMAAYDTTRNPTVYPYRVFIRPTGKLVSFRKFEHATSRTRRARGDILYQHDGSRWRIWTSDGLW